MYDTSMFYHLFLQEETAPPVKNTTKQNQDFRKAWVHLVFWIRMYLLSVVDNLEDKDVVAERVRKVPQEMIDIFKMYAPDSVTDPLNQSLSDFVNDTTSLIDAVKEGDVEKSDRMEAKINLDIAQLASAYSNLNSAYANADIQKMLKEYLALTKQEITARMTADYEKDVQTVDELEAAVLRLADYLSNGVGGK